MLKASAEIKFTIEGRDFSGKYFRPVFNIGDGIMISGALVSEHELYENNKAYNVDIDFFTVDGEAYKKIKHLQHFQIAAYPIRRRNP